jgi:hypothetical protein
MRLCADTFAILRNFASINKYLLIEPGSVLHTSAAGGVVARATVAEEFPTQSVFHDLGNFLSVASLFSKPDFDFQPTFVAITDEDGEAHCHYLYAPPSVVRKAREAPALPTEVIGFDLPEGKWSAIQRAASVLAKGEVRIASDGEAVQITTFDHSNPRGHTFSMRVAATPNGIRCQQILSRANLTMLAGPYHGTVTPRFTVFEHTGETDLKYWVGCNPSSTFG